MSLSETPSQSPGDPAQPTSAENGGSPFAAAFQQLMSRAPGPVFPRARRLYFDKYALEGSDPQTPFRTHLLEETIEERSDGSLHVQALRFAVVSAGPDHPDAGSIAPIDRDEAVQYLHKRWRQSPTDIAEGQAPWFRTNRSYLRVALSATYSNRSDPEQSLSAPGS